MIKVKSRNVPIIGWSKIIKIKDCNLFKGNNQNICFFTHSFFAEPLDKKIISSENNYFGLNIVRAFLKINFYTQFHRKKWRSRFKIIRKFQ